MNSVGINITMLTIVLLLPVFSVADTVYIQLKKIIKPSVE